MDVRPVTVAAIAEPIRRPALGAGRTPRQLPSAGGRDTSQAVPLAPWKAASESASSPASDRLYPAWGAARAFMADLSYVARAYTAGYTPAPAGTLVYLLA